MKSGSSSLVPLSKTKMIAIQNWREQPKQYYATLPTTTPRKIIEADTPTLWELRNRLGHPAAVAILVNAFIHAAKLVNLDRNLTSEQIGEAANDILEAYGYLKVEEVKFLLKRALRTQNVYGRLDYNVLMNWVQDYDAERTEEAIRISEHEESLIHNAVPSCAGAVSYDDYLASLAERAKTDEEAARILDDIKNPSPRRLTLMSANKRRDKDVAFKRWFYSDYLKK